MDSSPSNSPQRLTRESLEAFLPFLLPAGMTKLIGSQARARIVQLARGLLPVPRIAVECRPRDHDDQVDVQQNLRRDEQEYRLLAEYAATLASAHPGVQEMAAFRDFCAELATHGSLLWSNIQEIYLEFDLALESDLATGGPTPLPSLFLSLPEEPGLALSVVQRSLSLLGGEDVWPRLRGSVEQCMKACPQGAYIASLGIMLGRLSDAVRINVKRLLPSNVEAFLHGCGYPGDVAAAVQHFDDAVSAADRVTVALDAGRALYPRIGFECFLDEQPAIDLRWRFAFEKFCREHLCSAEKSADFLALPGDTLPSTATLPWPLEFVRQSLTGPPTVFSTFARRVFHFKVTHTPGRVPEVKAYFGAGHLWITPTAAPQHWRPTLGFLPTGAHSRRLAGASPHPVENAIAAGTSFLLERQLQSGFWVDFKAYGLGDEWVSAFIAVQLLQVGLPETRDAARACAERLSKTQRRNGGWGYCKDQAPDSDSTAWVLQLLQQLGLEASPAFQRGQAFLQSHSAQNGAVRTYADHADLAPRIGMPPDACFAGWEQTHLCVTAAAAPFLPASSRDFLRSSQQDGHWTGYWWVHDAYATAMAVEALQAVPAPGDDDRIALAQAWAAACIRRAQDSESAENANAFDTAFCLRILLSGRNGSGTGGTGHAAETSAAIRWLLDQQIAGGWLPAARLRIPQPDSMAPDSGAERIHLDYRANFTTAAVLGALALACREEAR